MAKTNDNTCLTGKPISLREYHPASQPSLWFTVEGWFAHIDDKLIPVNSHPEYGWVLDTDREPARSGDIQYPGYTVDRGQ